MRCAALVTGSEALGHAARHDLQTSLEKKVQMKHTGLLVLRAASCAAAMGMAVTS